MHHVICGFGLYFCLEAVAGGNVTSAIFGGTLLVVAMLGTLLRVFEQRDAADED